MPEDSLQAYVAAASDLRELITEAHKAIKDLKNVMREAKEFHEELTGSIESKIETTVENGLAQFGKELTDAIDVGTEKVFKRFEEITAICLGEDPKSRRIGLPSLASRLAENAQMNREVAESVIVEKKVPPALRRKRTESRK
jgi:Sec-independent protein translocase protein TatA